MKKNQFKEMNMVCLGREGMVYFYTLGRNKFLENEPIFEKRRTTIVHKSEAERYPILIRFLELFLS